jgi:hypothetical protein
MKTIVMFFKLCDHFHIDKSDLIFIVMEKSVYILRETKAIISIETNADQIVDEDIHFYQETRCLKRRLNHK